MGVGVILLELISRFGIAKLASIIGVTTAVLVGLMLIIFNLATPPMALLYSSLEYGDAGEIMTSLDQQGITYEVKGNGTMIFVPKDQVLNLRMDFASEGMPSGSVVGYEIFDNMDALGTTSFVQSINHLRALEGELGRTISSLSGIQSARVHLVIPERSVFGQNRPDPTASIMVRGQSGALTARHVQAIQNLVASAVPNLNVDNVSIINEAGNLLTKPPSNGGDGFALGAIDDRTLAFQERIRNQVEDIVESIVGQGRVRVQVSAELDFNRVVETSEIYDPDSQVARSKQTVEEIEQDSESEANESVSIGNNLPGQEQKEKASAPTSSSSANRLEETINYEISHTQRTSTQEGGNVKKVSVAVAIDGTYTENADGTQTYTPRTDEEIEQIRALVKSTIGYSEKRGDSIEIANLRFAQPAKITDPVVVSEPFMGLSKNDMMRIGEIVAAIIVAIILMLVIRTVLNGNASGGSRSRNQSDEPQQLDANGQPQLAAPANGQAAATGQGATALPAPPSGPQSEIAQQIDAAQIEGKIKESSIKKVGELVGAHPDESIAIIRTWMQEA